MSKHKCKVVSRKVKNVKRKKTVERTTEQWSEPKDTQEDELILLEGCLFKLGFCVVLLMTLLSSYCIFFNIVREKAEGNSRLCAKLL